MDEPPPIDDLISIMKEREAAIQAVSVRMTVLFGIRPPLPDSSRGPMAYTNDLHDMVEESAGRCRFARVTQMLDQNDAESGRMMDVVKIQVFSGENTRILTSSLEKPLIGEIHRGRSINLSL